MHSRQPSASSSSIASSPGRSSQPKRRNPSRDYEQGNRGHMDASSHRFKHALSPLPSPSIPAFPTPSWMSSMSLQSKRKWVNFVLILATCYALMQLIFPSTNTTKLLQRQVKSSYQGLRSGFSRRTSCQFAPSMNPLPVYEETDDIIYSNGPMSRHRPSHQFNGCSTPNVLLRPALTLITATKNPSPIFEQTLANIQAQSLQNFRWIIIDDHSDDPIAQQRLKSAAKKDKRIAIFHNHGTAGLAASRNLGLEAMRSDQSLQAPFVAMLDDDDLYELTALEKAIWMLESNPQWDLASFQFVKFGAQNTTERRGVHNGVANVLTENYVSNAAVIRASAIGSCRYDLDFALGGEDWDFWLCLADSGHWGGTLPELAYWYRVNDKAFRHARWGNTFEDGHANLKEKIQTKHPELHVDLERFPVKEPEKSVSLELSTWDYPFSNLLPDTASSGSIIFIVPWLMMGGADIGALRMVETLTQQGYRVTVVCTLYSAPDSVALRPLMAQWTHDIHVLPSFLRAHDFPRYIKYLTETRRAKTILFSNSMLAYEMLPALREQLPDTAFVDYLHNEAYDGWKSGGYPTYSILSQRYLDRTISCSHYLKNWMIERGHSESRNGVVKLGVDLEHAYRPNATEKSTLRRLLYSVGTETSIILSVARLDPQKRSLLFPQIIAHLVQHYPFSCGTKEAGKQPILMVMVGNGPLMERLRTRIAQFDVESCFILAGVQAETSHFYKSADVFLLPSMSEGISVAVSEAMSVGLPVIAADAGALSEQIGLASEPDRAGIVVRQTLDNTKDAGLYAEQVAELLTNRRLHELCAQNGEKRVHRSDWRQTLLTLLPELALAHQAHAKPRTPAELAKLPHPATALAIQTQLNEYRSFVDLSYTYQLLAADTRTGYGRELQLRCTNNPKLSDWIDSLEQPKSCDSREKLDVQNLQNSAKYQCGYWCIWDLRSKEPVGWTYNGKCFERMKGQACQDYFNIRPKTMLSEA